jgi:hypothetical protein
MMRKAAGGGDHRRRGSTAAFLSDFGEVDGSPAAALRQEAKGKAQHAVYPREREHKGEKR